jgi:hypothetical protein
MDVYQRRRLVALSILAVLFVVIVVVIRSCGGDDEEPVPTAGTSVPGEPTSLTQTEFAEQGDAACLETNTALASVDDSDAVLAATEEGQILAGELDSLQTLPPPEEGAEELERFLTALQDQVAAYDRYITALERGDDTAAAELEAEIDKAGSKARKAAKRFGFEVCGDPSQVGETSGGEETASEDGETSAEAPTDTATEAPTETAPVAPVEPATPAPTTPAEPAAPVEGGGATPEPAPAPPADGGSDSGGVSP